MQPNKITKSRNTASVCPHFGKPHVVRSPFFLVCQPAYCVLLLRVCPKSVGTRQALLQGWLACVGVLCALQCA
jgi:hypothetical protein